MNDFLNHVIDQIESAIGGWIMQNRFTAATIFIAALIVFYAWLIHRNDHRTN